MVYFAETIIILIFKCYKVMKLVLLEGQQI